jgi:hypothetical protein
MCSSLYKNIPFRTYILGDDLSINRRHWMYYNPPSAVAPLEQGAACPGLSVGTLISLFQGCKLAQTLVDGVYVIPGRLPLMRVFLML